MFAIYLTFINVSNIYVDLKILCEQCVQIWSQKMQQ